MKYMGSKARHAKEIIPFLKQTYESGMIYLEPFVGGANMFDKIDFVPNNLKFGCDVHEYLIAMWQAVSRGWMPPEVITEEEYNHIKNNRDDDKALSGYVGFALSYGGKWWGGWCRDKAGKRDYVREAYNNAQKQFPKLVGSVFIKKSVFDIKNINRKALIYCDPPYRNTTKYHDDFDHDRFYEWCRDRHKEGHIVFVSEYGMPEDFKCVWEKEVASSLTQDEKKKRATEKLFTLIS